MTGKRIAAIFLIFIGTLIAWMILGGVTSKRTNTSYNTMKSEVVSLYGGDLVYRTPLGYTKEEVTTKEWQNGVEIDRTHYEKISLEAIKSDINIDVSLDLRKKGNLWFPTYIAHFEGEYLFDVNQLGDDQRDEYFIYTILESSDSIYKDIILELNGKKQTDLLPLIKKEEFRVTPDKDGLINLKLSYESTGMENLYYYISESNSIAQLNDFNLTITTDFDNFNFPTEMMSPQRKIKTDTGYELIWELDQAVTGKDLGLVIPNKLNPGEIVTRVTFFAPVPLLFFFAVLLILTSVMKCPFHPMHYFFLAATFFSFHLMYSYFSDHLNLYLTFGISSVISLLLTITYLRLFAPPKVAYLLAPLTQLIYLVLFSYSFFFDGTTGLILTICSVVTLFVLMQITGRTDWESVFGKGDDKKNPPEQLQEDKI